MEIKLIANTEEKLSLVHIALCSGLPYFGGYGFSLEVNDIDYAAAAAALIGHPTLTSFDYKVFTKDNICREDVWVHLLRTGKALHFEDNEGDDSFDLTLELIEKNWDTVPGDICTKYYPEPIGDAITDDTFMQYLCFGEIVYG